MPHSDRISPTDWAVDRRVEQEAVHVGAELRRRARQLAQHLPSGSLTLLTTSAEGAALAGAITMLREDPTSWQVVHLGRRITVAGPVAVIEAVQLGEGVRRALARQFPTAAIVDGSQPPTVRLSDCRPRPARPQPPVVPARRSAVHSAARTAS